MKEEVMFAASTSQRRRKKALARSSLPLHKPKRGRPSKLESEGRRLAAAATAAAAAAAAAAATATAVPAEVPHVIPDPAADPRPDPPARCPECAWVSHDVVYTHRISVALDLISPTPADLAAAARTACYVISDVAYRCTHGRAMRIFAVNYARSAFVDLGTLPSHRQQQQHEQEQHRFDIVATSFFAQSRGCQDDYTRLVMNLYGLFRAKGLPVTAVAVCPDGDPPRLLVPSPPVDAAAVDTTAVDAIAVDTTAVDTAADLVPVVSVDWPKDDSPVDQAFIDALLAEILPPWDADNGNLLLLGLSAPTKKSLPSTTPPTSSTTISIPSTTSSATAIITSDVLTARKNISTSSN